MILASPTGSTGYAKGVGIFLWISLSSVQPIGLLMSGYASNNKYSLLGGLRAAAQSISYEIPLALAVLAVVMMSNSLSTLLAVAAAVLVLLTTALGLWWAMAQHQRHPIGECGVRSRQSQLAFSRDGRWLHQRHQCRDRCFI